MANKFFRPFLWVVTGCGILTFVYSCFRLDVARFDAHFAVLVGMALLLTSHITIAIPRFSSKISVSDTFVFLILLLYGGAAAVIVGAVEAFIWSMETFLLCGGNR
jgi:hypothetical protein